MGASNPSAGDAGYRAVAVTAPTAPTGVAATDGTYTDHVHVGWTAVSGATSYDVLRNTTNNASTASLSGQRDGYGIRRYERARPARPTTTSSKHAIPPALGMRVWGMPDIEPCRHLHLHPVSPPPPPVSPPPVSPPPVTTTPYTGTAAALPVRIQAEDFDNGGEGIAYHDLESANIGGANYRPGTGVDLQATGDPSGGGYQIAYTKAGEWLNYSINAGAGGSFNFDFRVASPAAGGQFHLEVDGARVTNAAEPSQHRRLEQLDHRHHLWRQSPGRHARAARRAGYQHLQRLPRKFQLV